jgi:flagellin-like hook-associated protein FlgL
MSEQTPSDGTPDGPAQDEAATAAPAASAGASKTWLIPAVTFLVGLALGAVVVAVTASGGDDSPSAGATPSGSPAPSVSAPTVTPTPDVSVTIPGPCIEVADDAQALLSLVDDAATAVRDLNASELSTILTQMQDAQTVLQDQVDQCQAAQATTP